jgi:hypothetical protein
MPAQRAETFEPVTFAFQSFHGGGGNGQNSLWLERNQFSRDRSDTIGFALPPAIRDPNVAARPSEPLESLPERSDLRLCLRVILGECHQHTHATHTFGLLRLRRKWPRRRAADECDEFPPPHGASLRDRAHSTMSLAGCCPCASQQICLSM